MLIVGRNLSMRIASQMPPVDPAIANTPLTKNANESTEESLNQNKENDIPKVTFQNAIDKLNEFMEVHNNNLKFVYHDGLKEYYVKVVDSKTDEVIREIPSKQVLDAYYEMQKIIGNIVDEKI